MAKLDKDSQEFVESMGLVFQADGLPRIAGRILGFLTIRDDAHSLQELADQLEVSRGSVSTNTRLLEQFGMIERIAKSGDRQGFYRLAAEAFPNVLSGAIQRMTKARQIIQKAVDRIPKKSAGARKNLADMSRFYDLTIKGMNVIVKDYSSPPGR
jgi:DNA-binding transcriptional regulator GbsR (MarR family)